MPVLGEIETALKLGYKSGTLSRYGGNKYIWQACAKCGKERWVRLVEDKPDYQLCKSCATKQRQRGRKNSHWKGGEHKSVDGYIMIYQPNHPRAQGPDGGRYVKRAVLVLEAKLGRYLLDGCVAHHINGIKTDDRPENLMELSRGEHMHLHWAQREKV